MKIVNGKYFYRRISIVIFSGILISTNVTASTTLLHDDFDGPLGSQWIIERGNAWTQQLNGEGWAYVQGSTAGSRDAFIITQQGGPWSDYSLQTRFYAEGGGNNWYQSFVDFRVQDMHGWDLGTFYQLSVTTPLWGSNETPYGSVSLARRIGDTQAEVALFTPSGLGVINNNDNFVRIDAIGDWIQVWINDQKVVDVHDANPILTGGVGLGAIWEARTRYDYVDVTEVVPIPATLWLISSGLLGLVGVARRRVRTSSRG